MAHHPEKFLDGRMLWRGRIYSPLPFVRSLWGTRINAGVWGTAAFPSVYRTDVHPFAFLPHSIRWQVLSFVLALGRRRRRRDAAATTGRRRCCSATGLVGIAVTVAKNVAYALRSDVDSLPGSRLWYRATVAYLHFLQPFARIRGRIRGVLSPPEVDAAGRARRRRAVARGRRSREAWRALLLDVGQRHRGSLLERDVDVGRTRARRSSPTGCGARAPCARSKSTTAGPTIATSACSSAAGPGSTCARSSKSTAAARALLRVSTHLRPTSFGVVSARGARRRAARRRRRAGVGARAGRSAGAIAAAVLALVVGRLRRVAHRAGDGHRAARRRRASRSAQGMVADASRARRARRSSRRRCCGVYGLRSAVIFVVMIVALGAGTFMLREAATGRRSSARARATPATTARRSRRGSTRRAASPSRRTATSTSPTRTTTSSAASTRATPIIATVVGNHDARHRLLRRQRAGDRARSSTRRTACAIAPDGDLIVADSHNDRIRRVDRPTRHHHDDRRLGRERLRRRRQAGDRGGAQHAERGRGGAQRRHLHRRHAELPHPDDRSRDRPHPHRGGRRRAGRRANRSATAGRRPSAHLNMPSDVAIGAERRHLHRRHASQPRPQGRREDAHHHDGRRQRHVGATRGDDGPATEASLAGPAGVARGARAGRQRDDLHRRLLQRPRARGRARRHHPRT